MTILGPTTAAELAESLAIPTEDVSAALVALESEGVILRGRFTHPPSSESIATEWCDRRLLARIHRYTLNRLRAEIEPVAPADFMRFLFSWQHADGSSRLTGIDGLRTIVGVLDGFELAASAWERSVLPTRMDRYEPAMLDTLCLTGDVGWARLSRPDPVVSDIVAATPIALFLREHADVWCETGERDDPADEAVLDALRTRGALFFHQIDAACGLGEKALRTAIARLAAAGLITSDGFAGVRALLNSNTPLKRAGRWSVVRRTSLAGEPPSRMGASAGQGPPSRAGASARQSDAIVETHARALLRRYGVVFRRLLAREIIATPWRDLVRVYRRLEARGEIRGGRFVSGMSGEQFALPEAVERMREVRRGAHDGRYVTISAADPLNLTGVVTTGERVRAIAGHRIVYRNGVPLAVLEGEYLRPLAEIAPNLAAEVATALVGRPMPPILSGFVGAISR
jgi:ATP-dependent Lhr-like helicase